MEWTRLFAGIEYWWSGLYLMKYAAVNNISVVSIIFAWFFENLKTNWKLIIVLYWNSCLNVRSEQKSYFGWTTQFNIFNIINFWYWFFSSVPVFVPKPRFLRCPPSRFWWLGSGSHFSIPGFWYKVFRGLFAFSSFTLVMQVWPSFCFHFLSCPMGRSTKKGKQIDEINLVVRGNYII